MKINKKQLAEKIGLFISSTKFQSAIPDVNMTKNTKKGWTIQEIEIEINKVKKILLNAARYLTRVDRKYPTAINLSSKRWVGVSPDHILSHKITNIKRSKSDNAIILSCKVELYFNPDVVSSPSLLKHSDGVDNLLQLLTNGWDFRGKSFKSLPKGTWYVGATKNGVKNRDGAIHDVYVKRYRPPDARLFNAIDNYNTKSNRRISVSLSNKYISIENIGLIRFGL